MKIARMTFKQFCEEKFREDGMTMEGKNKELVEYLNKEADGASVTFVNGRTIEPTHKSYVLSLYYRYIGARK